MSLGDALIRGLSQANVRLYRWSRGRVGGRVGRSPILLLTTRGRRSGKARTTPLLYLRDGADVAIVASYGGRPQHPAWYLNILSDQQVDVQIGSESFHATARTASPEERNRLWPKLVEMYASYASYQAKTSREIPVVLLTPSGEHA